MTSLVLAATVGVAGFLGENRILQGSDDGHAAYTEVHDRVLNRVVERDRAVDAEWLTAAKAGPEALAAKQRTARAAWVASMGGFPARCPLDVHVTGTFRRDGYRIEKVYFASRPNHHVTATVFVPDDPKFKAPYPAVAVGCGHSFAGKMIANYQRPGVLGAKNGFVVIVYDPIDQGERYQRRDAAGRKSRSTTGEHNNVGYRAMLLGWNTAQFRIWDGMRAIDYLCARPDVDRTKIAVTGHSGGGTESSYLMALDERVTAACPSGFITSVRELAYLCGPQDAEQKFYGQLAFGMNHLGILMLRAGRCAEMPLTTHADFFPFVGATDTRDRATEAFAAIGKADQFAFVHASGPHLWPESSMLAEFRWFRKWLKGEDCWKGYDPVAAQKVNIGFRYDDPAVDIGLMREKDNLSSPTGFVVDLPGERTVYDILRDELAATAGNRKTADAAIVARLAGVRGLDALSADLLNRREAELSVAGKTVRATAVTLYRNDDGIALPLFVFRPQDATGTPLLLTSDTRFSTNLAPRVEAALAAGRPVAVAEMRQFGYTARFVRSHGENASGRFYGCADYDEMTAAMMEWLGESLVGRRTEDLLLAVRSAADILGTSARFDVLAEGRAAVPAAHAYGLARSRFGSFSMARAPRSWTALFADDAAPYRFADAVHGALRHYDWTDLVR